MPARCLTPRLVERVWGVRDLPAAFAGLGAVDPNAPVGEVWHEDAGTPHPLLIKHLFTSQRLSIQVHPDDEMARARGLERGKDEAWFVFDAAPDAVIGLGLKQAVDADAFRAAAISGAIEGLVDWKPVKAGDFYYAPAGTVHAIGGGLGIIEIQQSSDTTYRLYDYGRPRELHLDDGVAVSTLAPWSPLPVDAGDDGDRERLVMSDKFSVERWRVAGDVRADFGAADVLLIPADAALTIDGHTARAGEVWRASGPVVLGGSGATLLVAASTPHEAFALAA